MRRLTELADVVVDALGTETDLPFAFFGHSLGAVVAYEVARQLPDHDRLRALFLSGAAAPHLGLTRRGLADLPEPELLDEVRAYGGTPAEVLDDPTFVEAFLPVLRADFAMFETYTPGDGAWLDRPAYLYGGDSDDRVSPARLWAWRDLVDVASVKLFPGGHFYLRDARGRLTASIRRELAGQLRAARAA